MLKRGCGLQRDDGATSGMQGAKSKGNGIPSGMSECPYRRGRSEIFESNEEAAQRPASSCMARQRAKRTDLRRLWIPEEVGCHLQEGVPPCSRGMAEENPFQEYSNPWKLWIPKEINHRWQEDNSPCKSGMVQDRRCPKELDQGQS
jgi:hypothetical protein